MPIQRIIKATQYSWDGLKELWFESAFRQEIYLSIVLIPIFFLLNITGFFKLLLILLLLLLLVIEAVNSALEAVVDRISLEIHPQSKLAKDAGSAAVLLVFIMNFIAWGYAVYLHFYG